MMIQTELEIELVNVIRSRWGDNGIEYLIGAMSTIATQEQLTALLNANR
jgi:hypothetical protein